MKYFILMTIDENGTKVTKAIVVTLYTHGSKSNNI